LGLTHLLLPKRFYLRSFDEFLKLICVSDETDISDDDSSSEEEEGDEYDDDPYVEDTIEAIEETLLTKKRN
jgi:hypothetical protein